MNKQYVMVASSALGGAAIGFVFGAYLARVKLNDRYEESLASHYRAMQLAMEKRPTTEVEDAVTEVVIETDQGEGIPKAVEETMTAYGSVFQPNEAKSDIPVKGVEDRAESRDLHNTISYIQAEDFYGAEEIEKHKIEIVENDGGRFFEVDGIGYDEISSFVGTSYFFDFEANQMNKYPGPDGVTTFVRNHEENVDYEIFWSVE